MGWSRASGVRPLGDLVGLAISLDKGQKPGQRTLAVQRVAWNRAGWVRSGLHKATRRQAQLQVSLCRPREARSKRGPLGGAEQSVKTWNERRPRFAARGDRATRRFRARCRRWRSCGRAPPSSHQHVRGAGSRAARPWQPARNRATRQLPAAPLPVSGLRNGNELANWVPPRAASPGCLARRRKNAQVCRAP